MNKPYLILVAGGSASGKSTVVEKILKRANINEVLILTHDDYYKYQDKPLTERIKMNYDHPDSLDNDLLYNHIIKLLNNESIKKPIYDFINYNPKKVTETIYPKSIIIIEGILILHDKKIRDLANLKLYVESDDDIRLIRRLKRDINERKRSIDSVINQYLETVKPMYHKYIKPTKRYADIIIPNDNTHDIAVDVIVSKIKQVTQEGK